MTGLDPDVRFDKHKAAIESNRYAREYGLGLTVFLYTCGSTDTQSIVPRAMPWHIELNT